MSKQITYQESFKSYYHSALHLPSDAKNYLNRQVETIKGCGNSAYEVGVQTMDQISKFPTRAKAFYHVIDKTAYSSYKGLMLGGMIGFFTGGIIGAYAGAQTGAQLGAWIGLFNGINDLADQIHAEDAAQK